MIANLIDNACGTQGASASRRGERMPGGVRSVADDGRASTGRAEGDLERFYRDAARSAPGAVRPSPSPPCRFAWTGMLGVRQSSRLAGDADDRDSNE
jgi:hypothetical protein